VRGPGTAAETAGQEKTVTVERTQAGHRTRYELRDNAALRCVLTYGGPGIEPAAWKILLPGPGGTEDLYGTEQFLTPDARQLQAWLSPIVGARHAAELADAVDADPPLTSGWERRRHGGG
jgi:hypothetical protein